MSILSFPRIRRERASYRFIPSVAPDLSARSEKPCTARKSDEIERLWEQTALRVMARTLQGSRALVMGFEVEELASIRRALRGFGIAPVASCPSATQIADVAKMHLDFDFLLIDFDAFPSVEDGVDALLEFRKRNRHAVVVLVSANVAADDLGTERRAICDATLRAPVTDERMRRGLLDALVNKAEFKVASSFD